MAHQEKELDAKPGNLSLIPRIHITEGENQRLEIVLWPSPVGRGMYNLHLHIH